jgi:hypothetical protein
MGFFDFPPDDDEPTNQTPQPEGWSAYVPPRQARDRLYAPGVVGQSIVLACSEDAALLITGLEVTPDRLRFALVVIASDGAAPTSHCAPELSTDDPDDVLIGVALADGTRASGHRRLAYDRDGTVNPNVRLRCGGGFGNASTLRQMWSLTPLPEDGLDFVGSWSREGISETRASLTGAAIRDALGRAQRLWPDI